MTKGELTKIFGKFVGREVPLVEQPFTVNGKTYTQMVLADKNDPTLSEMTETAHNNGLVLRIWWPGIFGTADFRKDRVNAHIEHAPDGKWRVADNFTIG